MAHMIRKQVYIEQRQDRVLKRRAKQRGVTEAEIIREALDGAEINGRSGRTYISDESAARKALAFMRSLATRGDKTHAGRTGTRESLPEG